MISGAGDIQLRELNDTILQLNNTISAQNELIASLKEMLEIDKVRSAEKDQLIANLQRQLDELKTKVFGSTSEVRRYEIPGQLSLFDSLEEESKPAVEIEPEYVEVKEHKRERKPKATYDEIFADIPSRDIAVEPLSEEDRICPECGTLMEPLGTEIVRTEILFHPSWVERINYVAKTYKCPNVHGEDEKSIFAKDKCPEAFIPESYASESLVTDIAYQKYVMASPLYRLEQSYEQMGIKLSRGTMARWIIASSKLYLSPVYDYLHRKLLERQFLMADETPLQVLDEPGRRAQSKSYVWVVRTGEDRNVPIILFNYTETRKGANASDFLSGATKGYFLMTDGYKGYNKVPDANRCACWAHIRRYWLKAIPKGHEKDYTHPAVQGFMYCDKLFYYERTYKEKGLSPKQIYKRRLKDQEPVIDAFLAWIDKLRPKTGDSIIKAMTYTNGCRPYLKNYLKDGCCSLSNNLSENAIRPVVMGRKNWLFSESQDGADATVKYFSIIETAKANGIDVKKYLTYLFKNRPSTEMSDEDLEKLMPWSKETREACE